MAEQDHHGGKGQALNDRTHQEVEYLKKNLGPILVAALAEICIRRPADPIEYLGHWLLRWRYNEELKRRDVQNALEVVRQKAWNKDDESIAPPAEVKAGSFNQGFTPDTPYGAPGYGGPVEGGAEGGEAPRRSGESEGMAAASGSGERRVSAAGSTGEERRMSKGGAGSGEMKRMSGEERRASEAAGRRVSGDPGVAGEPMEERRASRKSGEQMEEPEQSGENPPAPEDPEPEPVAE